MYRSLISSKTEFLLIDLNITHSAHNFGFIFDEHLTLSNQISVLSKSRYSHICELRCICPYLDISKQLVPSPPRLFTPSLIIVIHSTLVSINPS